METEIIKPLFEKYCLTDILPSIQNYLNNNYKNTQYSILEYKVIFENCENLSSNCLHIILNIVKNKYLDFITNCIKIIDTICNKMRSTFIESHVCKLYKIPHIDYTSLEVPS